jgi:hypothetical protein
MRTRAFDSRHASRAVGNSMYDNVCHMCVKYSNISFGLLTSQRDAKQGGGSSALVVTGKLAPHVHSSKIVAASFAQ